MNSITVRCKMCKHAMKFSAEKAGKRTKCSKCDAILVVEAAKEPAQKKDADDDAIVAVEEPKPTMQEEEDVGAYGVFLDPELEERKKALAREEERRAKAKDKKNLPNVTRKVKAIHDAESWTSVRTGMFLMIVGAVFWLFGHLLQGTYVLVGYAEFPAFGVMMQKNIEEAPENPEPGRGRELNWLNVYLEMIAGANFRTFARVCLTISTLLYFAQAICWGVGYMFYLQVPRRFGMFGQTLTMMALAFFNVLVMFGLKLLPVLGAHSYVIIPLLTPEVAINDYNTERMVPIHILWSAAPFWENMLTILIRFTMYLEPALGCIFLWSAGMAMKDSGVAKSGRGLTEMCLGTLFVLICFQLLSLCGASPILVGVLRVIYGLWYFFLILFLVNFTLVFVKARAVLAERINPKNELKDKKNKDDDDDEDDD